MAYAKRKVWKVVSSTIEQRPTGEDAKKAILEKARDLYFPSFDGAFDALTDSELWDAIQDIFCIDLEKSYSHQCVVEIGQRIANFYDSNK